MGRASNRKWAARIAAWTQAKASKRLDMLRLFGRHPKFRVAR